MVGFAASSEDRTMGSFRTRSGRCVVEHGEIRLETLGVRGRLERYYENATLAHKQRYQRGVLRFVGVLLFAVLSVGQVAYRLLFGEWQVMATGLAFGVGLVGVIGGYFIIRKRIRRWLRGFTGEQTIRIRAVESVDPRPKGLFREPHLVVHYDEYGTEKKRYVGVCTLTPLAEDEFEAAKALLLDEHDLSITAP
jgi:uncharacterized integral membrane protein